MSDVKADAKAIFLKALECQAPDELHRFLDDACNSDAALRARAQELLRAHQDAGNFLGGIQPLDTTQDEPVAERPGTVVGPYKLLEQIGEGGFGVVFMAEQQQPLRRKVALKVLKPGMDTRQVVTRFEAERQTLALMDHPNIAKVFDAGTTASGRPYFVMELVRGVSITEFCDQRRFTPRQRLELFVLVCQAVQHAHQKGIIHRDLKPTNVLVTLHDVAAVPKVIDFGIAKATTQRLTERTLFTHFAQMVGTPLYMSPEQAEMNGPCRCRRGAGSQHGLGLAQGEAGRRRASVCRRAARGGGEQRHRGRQAAPASRRELPQVRESGNWIVD
jgi:serine/threonine-protein kinase